MCRFILYQITFRAQTPSIPPVAENAQQLRECDDKEQLCGEITLNLRISHPATISLSLHFSDKAGLAVVEQVRASLFLLMKTRESEFFVFEKGFLIQSVEKLLKEEKNENQGIKTCLTLKKKSPAKPFLRLEKLFEKWVSKIFKKL